MSNYQNPNENEINQNQGQPIPQGGEPPRTDSQNWNVEPEQNHNYGVPVGTPYTPQEPNGYPNGYPNGMPEQPRTSSAYQQPQPPPQQPQRQQYSAAGGWQTAPPRNQQYSASSGWQATPPQPEHEERLPKKRKGIRIFLGSIACILAVSVVGLAGYGVYNLVMPDADTMLPISDQSSSESGAAPIEGVNLQDVPNTETPIVDGERLTTEQIVEKVSPSVVAILIYQGGYTGGATGMGSGIIIREDGYIVTNAHVVEGASGLVVQKSNGDTAEARIIGVDSQTDLAVIKIDETNLPASIFGNSDQIKVGGKVIAIGNPRSMQFYGSVTQGIVSGLNRHLTAYDTKGISTDYTNLIQTDAAINQGNSGGALVNEYGQVIGINVAKSGGNGVEGLGFAIPSNSVKEVVDDLINVGYVTGRVQLGIRTKGSVNEVEARNANLPYGIWVNSTEEGSDISKKGVLPGDIITKIDETDITTMGDVKTALDGKKPGETVQIEVFRPSLPNTGKKPGKFQIKITLMEVVQQASTTQQQPPQQEQPQQEQPQPQVPFESMDPFSYFFGQFS